MNKSALSSWRKAILSFMLVILMVGAEGQVIPDQATLKAHAPPVFRALFHTGKGDFTVEVIREWSPLAADRLWQLLSTGFYNGNSLFRVQKDYVVQFGICDIPAVNAFWDHLPIPDEPVMAKNLRGVISYARDGMNSRTSQLFINMKDNPKLDTIMYNGLRGFPPVARIVEGFETVEAFNGKYGFEPANHQDSMMVRGKQYLEAKFPGLDTIGSVEFLTQ